MIKLKKTLTTLILLSSLPILSNANPAAPKSPFSEPGKNRQVRISAKILEWTHQNTFDWGFSILYSPNNSNSDIDSFDATFPKQAQIDQGLTFFFDNIQLGDEGAFDAVIETLEQYGNVEVISEPSVVVFNAQDVANKKHIAKVSTKSRVPYENAQPAGNVLAQITSFKDTSIQLTVSVNQIVENIHPKLQNEFVELDIKTSITDLSGFISVALNENGDPLLVPQTDTRLMESIVLVPDGQLFIPGILKTTSKFDREQGIPILARIPLLGYFFKNKQKRDNTTELLFLVRAEILKD